MTIMLLHADDAMAILSAFNSPEIEVVGITTIFGNVYTETATQNAFILLHLSGQEQVRWIIAQDPGMQAFSIGALSICPGIFMQVPVAEGSHVSFNGTRKDWVADFVHGKNGFGDVPCPQVQVRIS
jgi:inosine-uridine nucleoside N-ribohydrolase